MKPRRPPSHVLILWRWEEAVISEGEWITDSTGGHMKYARPGDTLYICALSGGEVYLLGSVLVKRVRREPSAAARRKFGPYMATGKNRSGPFGLYPLGSDKWRLRFESDESDRLRRSRPLGLQLRARRYLTSESARLLDQILKARRVRRTKALAAFRMEGRQMVAAMTVRKRDVAIRRSAIRRYGRRCRICEIDMVEAYGDFAADCIEVHHLDPIGSRSRRGSRTTLEEVIVVCPNCHRALHRFDDPAAWRRFRTACGYR